VVSFAQKDPLSKKDPPFLWSRLLVKLSESSMADVEAKWVDLSKLNGSFVSKVAVAIVRCKFS